ncbi:MAG TPA: flagellar export chaperone FliS [Cyanobacteria bacterium UBA8530]|nr:flagellar export chaperone FliS [Cyanobacteria bacterium UBA8530]
MNQAVFNPYAQYQEAQYETAPRERLLLMLFDGLIRFNNAAIMAMQAKDNQKAHDCCLKVENILVELMATLNFDANKEVAQNLFDLYEFLQRQTVQANVKKDPAILNKIHHFYVDLKETWSQAARNIAIEKKRATA